MNTGKGQFVILTTIQTGTLVMKEMFTFATQKI